MTIEEAIINLEDGIYWLKNNEEPELLKRIRFSEALEIAISVLRAQQETEKNKPLTRKELQEMDGRPIWIMPISGKTAATLDEVDNTDWMSQWAIRYSDPVFVSSIRQEGRLYGLFDKNYGKVWIAYHRPPERNEK